MGKNEEEIEKKKEGVEKIVIVGVGEKGKIGNEDWMKIGGEEF